jgi:hypothetical protein
LVVGRETYQENVLSRRSLVKQYSKSAKSAQQK